jgi:twinkle protein
MDWQDVERQMCDKAEEVCRHLLPQGKREGAEWVCGSVEGQAGRSLKVNLGGKVGVWADFAGDGDNRGKTLMSLWCSVRAKPFKFCIVEAKGFLGIRDDFERRVKSYDGGSSSPSSGPAAGAAQKDDSAWKAVGQVWPRCQPLTEGGPVWNYLVDERRLAPEVVEWYGVREMVSGGRWVMVFPYYAPAEEGGEQVSVVLDDGQSGRVGGPTWLKFERLDRVDGKKSEWTTPGPEKCLWGAQVSTRSEFKAARHVLICEGEKDAMTWASYGCALWGIVPVSVPFGAKWKGQVKGHPSPNREWLDRCWDWLQGFETVFVAMDSDEAGRRAAADIISEVGPRRCRLVELPLREGVTAKSTEGTKN